MSKRKIKFIATGLVMMLFGITMVVVGTINNYLTIQFGVDKLFIGLCAAVLAVGILAGSFLFGPLSDRFGYKPIMLAGILLVGSGLGVIILISNVSFIPYLFFMIGWGGGMLNGVTNVVVADIYPENSSAYLSLLGAFFGIGALGLPLVTSVLLANGFSYGYILTSVALVLLIPFVLVLLLKFPHAKRVKALPAKEYFRFFTKQGILLLGLFLFFQGALEAVVPVWTPVFLSEAFEVDYDRGLYAITIGAIGITVTRLVLSRVLKKHRPWFVVFISLIIVFAGVLLLEVGPSFYWGLAGVGLMGVGMAASFPVILGYTAEFYQGNSGTAFSIVLGISLIGNISLSALTGYILNVYGIEVLEWIFISFIVMMFIILKIIHSKLIKNKDFVSKTVVA